MSKLTDAVKAAGQAIFGTSIPGTGGAGGTPPGGFGYMDGATARSIVDGLTAGDLYETQPHLRTVVSFVARNGAQLGRQVFKRTADDGRERVRDSALAKVLNAPNDYMTGYDLFTHLFSELALYDFALWVPKLGPKGWQIDPIPGTWIVGTETNAFGQVTRYKILTGTNNQFSYWVDASQVIVFRGYSPAGFKSGSTAVRTLKGNLGEQVAAMDFRKQMWDRGGRVGMFLSRPKEAPEWSPEAKAKFIQNWKSSWSGGGANAGSTPLLEDGMKLERIGFNAKEEQWLEAATLSLSTVAAAYHVPPAMVGVAGFNSFASVKEFRKMLYTETLGPSVAQAEDVINQFLAPFIGEPDGNYFELNIHEKLQGDFQEEAEQLFKAVGGPYMTPNEARKKINQPAVEGGDVLLAPLNMGAAGNNGPAADAPITSGASETDPADETPTDPKKSTTADVRHSHKASGHEPLVSKALEADLEAYFDRVKRVTLAKIGQKAEPDWWSQKKWNQELSSLLLPHLLTESAGVARKAAAGANLNPDDYSVAQTENFLKAVSDSRADLVNATVRDHYVDALEKGTDPATVYEDTKSHAQTVSNTLLTFIGAFATVEAAKQLAPAGTEPTKTWLSSGKPNSRHSALNGETVPINSKFSNGANWPGDPVLGAKGVSNCACGVDINY